MDKVDWRRAVTKVGGAVASSYDSATGGGLVSASAYGVSGELDRERVRYTNVTERSVRYGREQQKTAVWARRIAAHCVLAQDDTVG